MHESIENLRATVAGLEAAIAAPLQRAAREADRMRMLQAEVTALRATQQTMADRLDAAIARLKSSLGD